jgi:hypothetical protein
LSLQRHKALPPPSPLPARRPLLLASAPVLGAPPPLAVPVCWLPLSPPPPPLLLGSSLSLLPAACGSPRRSNASRLAE